MPIKKFSPISISFIQSSLLVIYVSLVSLVFSHGNQWFGPVGLPLGPIFFFLLFIISAIISPGVSFGYPLWLFFVEKKYREALRLALYTTVWLVLYCLLFFVIIIKK